MKKIKVVLPYLVLCFGIAISGTIAVKAQEVAPIEKESLESQITFPIPELGNCNTKEECKKYCDDTAHIAECVSFAEKHGLMKQEEAERARRFGEELKSGKGGPGSCKTPEECESFCRNIKNIETCMAFAEKHGLKDKHIEQGKKILSYIKSGGEMPGNCTDKASCERYCGDFSHAEECFMFARRTGILQEKKEGYENEFEPEEKISEDQLQKLVTIVKQGETPGGCKSKNECEMYCKSGDHVEECVAFGEKMGFIKAEEAARMKKIGSAGPGGCKGAEECKKYCADPGNHDECFRFAEEHELIGEEELARMKEETQRFKGEMERMPPDVRECLAATLGESKVEELKKGTVPTFEIGERVRMCFEKARKVMEEKYRKEIEEKMKREAENMQSYSSERMGENSVVKPEAEEGTFKPYQENKEGYNVNTMPGIPPQVMKCVEEHMPEAVKEWHEKGRRPTPAIEEAISKCFNERWNEKDTSPFMPKSEEMEAKQKAIEEYKKQETGTYKGAPQEPVKTNILEEIMRRVPSEVSSCIKKKYKIEDIERMLISRRPEEVIGKIMAECGAMNNTTKEVSGSTVPRTFEGEKASMRPLEVPMGRPSDMVKELSQISPKAAECIRVALGENYLEKVTKGEINEQDIENRIKTCIMSERGTPTPFVTPKEQEMYPQSNIVPPSVPKEMMAPQHQGTPTPFMPPAEVMTPSVPPIPQEPKQEPIFYEQKEATTGGNLFEAFFKWLLE